jgi:NAD(P)-dependent dehydrogenase (short-subunit alcohol dehydrogenase family)
VTTSRTPLVTDQQAVAGAVDALGRQLGSADLLVNNAGVSGPFGDAWEVDAGEWWRAVEINLRGAYLCSRAVLPAMAARGAGRIVNITSQAGVYRWPQVSAYSVSKAAVIKFTENLAAGDADRLSGCHLSVYDDLDAILACGESVRGRCQLRLASARQVRAASRARG